MRSNNTNITCKLTMRHLMRSASNTKHNNNYIQLLINPKHSQGQVLRVHSKFTFSSSNKAFHLKVIKKFYQNIIIVKQKQKCQNDDKKSKPNNLAPRKKLIIDKIIINKNMCISTKPVQLPEINIKPSTRSNLTKFNFRYKQCKHVCVFFLYIYIYR